LGQLKQLPQKQHIVTTEKCCDDADYDESQCHCHGHCLMPYHSEVQWNTGHTTNPCDCHRWNLQWNYDEDRDNERSWKTQWPLWAIITVDWCDNEADVTCLQSWLPKIPQCWLCNTHTHYTHHYLCMQTKI